MTLVTMFFDLTPFTDSNHETRGPAFYVEHGRTVMSLKAPMVIFCDETTEPLIRTLRTHPETVYVVKPLQSYDYFNVNYSVVQLNRKMSRGYKHADRNTPSYFLLTMFKVVALQLANRINPFGSTHVAWIDFGCNHFIRGVDSAPTILAALKPRVAVTYIHYRSHAELSNMAAYMEYGAPCGIAATFFTVEASYVDLFASAMFAVFYDMLAHGFGHTEETVMVYCYDRYPDMFTLTYGDYYSVITNYIKPTQDLECVRRNFIQNAQRAGRDDLATEALKQISA